MTTNEKREAIRIKVVEAVPEVVELKLGATVSEKYFGSIKKHTIVERYVGGCMEDYWTTVDGSKVNTEDIIEVIGRPITALDILSTFRANNQVMAIDSCGVVMKYYKLIPRFPSRWEDVFELNLSHTLDQWDESTIDKVYELYYE